MRTLVYYCLSVAIALCAFGYVRGWFGPTKPVNSVVRVDFTNYEDDKRAFSQSVDAKAKAINDQFAGLDKKSADLVGDDQARAQQKLVELHKRYFRLEEQIKEMKNAGDDEYETIKADLSKSLEDVEKQAEELKVNMENKTGS